VNIELKYKQSKFSPKA